MNSSPRTHQVQSISHLLADRRPVWLGLRSANSASTVALIQRRMCFGVPAPLPAGGSEDDLTPEDLNGERVVCPELAPFGPARGTALVAHPPLDPAMLSELLAVGHEIVVRHKMSLGPECVPCQHNTLTFPWDRPQVAA